MYKPVALFPSYLRLLINKFAHLCNLWLYSKHYFFGIGGLPLLTSAFAYEHRASLSLEYAFW